MKIVLTGGPSAGKTTIAEALERAYWDRLVLAPESASILFRGGFPRDSSGEAVIYQQRAIYHVQHELEHALAFKNPHRALICDRGTLDGLAFWPLPEKEFFRQVGTTKEKELSNYSWVIHLETAASEAYRPSPIRLESFVEAKSIDEKLKNVWSAHPNWTLVSNHLDFSVKITRTLLAVKMILDGEPAAKIQNFLKAPQPT